MTDIELIEDLCRLKRRLDGHPEYQRTVRLAVVRIIQFHKENAVGKTANIIGQLNAKILDLSKQLADAKAEPKLDAEDLAAEASFNEDGTPVGPTPATTAAA